MQTSARFADIGNELLFDRHVYVFVVDIEREVTVVDAPLDVGKAFDDLLHIFFADDALGSEHARVGDRPRDILLVELLVYWKRCTEALRELADVFSEAA